MQIFKHFNIFVQHFYRVLNNSEDVNVRDMKVGIRAHLSLVINV